METLNLLREAAFNRTSRGGVHPQRGRIKLSKPGVEVEIPDLDTKLRTGYESIRKAINLDLMSLLRRENLS